MWLTRKLVELQGISEIFLSRTLHCKNKLFGWRNTVWKICTSLFSAICKNLSVPDVLYLSVFKPILIEQSTICHFPLLLLLFLTVVMDILWMWLWQKWSHLHVGGEPVLTVGSFTSSASLSPRTEHLGHWPVSLVPSTIQVPFFCNYLFISLALSAIF